MYLFYSEFYVMVFHYLLWVKSQARLLPFESVCMALECSGCVFVLLGSFML